MQNTARSTDEDNALMLYLVFHQHNKCNLNVTLNERTRTKLIYVRELVTAGEYGRFTASMGEYSYVGCKTLNSFLERDEPCALKVLFSYKET